MTPEERYYALRQLAMQGDLEAFVAMKQLDHIRDQDKFDAAVDAALEATSLPRSRR